jgi:large subunit ribosomal protein L10
MNKTEKHELVEELRAGLANAKSVVVTSHVGMDVNTVNALRAEFRKQGVSYHIVKNTLVRLAVAGTELEPLGEICKGPSALAWSTEDAPTPAKIARAFKQKNDKFVIKGGVLVGAGALDAKGVDKLADMLSKEELQAKLLGVFKAVPEKFVRTLNAVPQKAVMLLSARKDDIA